MSLGSRVYRAIHRGFQAAKWQEGPFIYCLVSDSDAGDLSSLVEKLRHKQDRTSRVSTRKRILVQRRLPKSLSRIIPYQSVGTFHPPSRFI